jgi:hypothetical protein
MGDGAVSGWIDHDGKGMPVDGKTIVDVQFRDGNVYGPETVGYWAGDKEDPRDYWVFCEKMPQDDIVRYRVLPDDIFWSKESKWEMEL